jgi:hypothetical protein
MKLIFKKERKEEKELKEELSYLGFLIKLSDSMPIDPNAIDRSVERILQLKEKLKEK